MEFIEIPTFTRMATELLSDMDKMLFDDLVQSLKEA